MSLLYRPYTHPVGALDGITTGPDFTDAACAGHDPELWFPTPPGDYTTARGICETCPIRDRCLAYAMRREGHGHWTNRHGMWGGKTPDERWRMERQGRPK